LQAFYECPSLKNITFPANLKEIGWGAFAWSGLERVIFEEGSDLVTIGDAAFWGNHNLQTINIPSGVEIKTGAFEDTGCPMDIFTPGATIMDCIVNFEKEGPNSTKVPLRCPNKVPSK